MKMPIYIAVIGPSRAGAGETSAAEMVGALVAEAGALLVCGGGGGAMEAACRGARSKGGTTIGILPGRSRDDANRFVDVAIPTGMGEARNAIVVRTADAVIAVGGGTGTLSEIGLALKMGRPVVGLSTWHASLPGEAGSGAESLPIVRVATPREAVDTALRLGADRGIPDG
jgi:uncharacterized protein (TIGR00725 family)